MSTTHKCLFLDGPWDGRCEIIPDELREYVIRECPIPEFSLSAVWLPSVRDGIPIIRHLYKRTTTRTFLYDSIISP